MILVQNINHLGTETTRARIFTSCGQRKGEETELANVIANMLVQRGFDPYIAVEEQVLRGFTQNILPRLEECEYYLFIDFRREVLIDNEGNRLGNRGSLFSHQELAIATFLDKPVIAFREQGVIGRDGVAGFLQINPSPFDDRQQLPNLVEAAITESGWNPTTRNELILNRIENEFEDVIYGPARIPARFYHIQVRNLNHNNTARNCTVYLQSVRNLQNDQEFFPEPVEMKWKGLRIQSSLIPPRYTREFDGIIFFPQSNETYIGMNSFLTDYTGYLTEYRLSGPGRFLLEYVVFCDNFRPTRRRFIVSIGNDMQIISLQNE
jgi:hypothetical protein